MKRKARTKKASVDDTNPSHRKESSEVEENVEPSEVQEEAEKSMEEEDSDTEGSTDLEDVKGKDVEGEAQEDEREQSVGAEVSISGDSDDAMDSDHVETVPSLPLKMYFGPEVYMKPFKLYAKCYIKRTVDTLESHLNSREKRWFWDHPQFKHFFHMPRDNNHTMMGMWMLMLRTAYTEKKKEVWFVVNGVPIRYSLKEFALMSGLYCHQYPNYYERLGSLTWAGKQFGSGTTITFKDVEEKLLEMKKGTPDRMKMAVLYFLCSIIVGKRKSGSHAQSVEPFFLRAVDDLNLCKTFSWGRFAFDENLKDLSHILTLFKGTVGAQQIFPSFVLPLEILAFEAIPTLMNEYREHVRESHPECPLMCKMRFKKTPMKGIPMDELLEKLGITKQIQSIMSPSPDEKVLVKRIMDERVGVDDADCGVVDGWMRRLTVDRKPIWFEELYNKDLAARRVEKKAEGSEAQENVGQGNVAKGKRSKGGVRQGRRTKDKGSVAEDNKIDGLVDLVKKLNNKLDEQNTRITKLEANVRYLGGEWNNEPPPPRTESPPPPPPRRSQSPPPPPPRHSQSPPPPPVSTNDRAKPTEQVEQVEEPPAPVLHSTDLVGDEQVVEENPAPALDPMSLEDPAPPLVEETFFPALDRMEDVVEETTEKDKDKEEIAEENTDKDAEDKTEKDKDAEDTTEKDKEDTDMTKTLKNVYGRSNKKRTREEKEKEKVPEAADGLEEAADGLEEPAEATDGEEEPIFQRVKIIPKKGKGKGKTILTRTTPVQTRGVAKKKKSN